MCAIGSNQTGQITSNPSREHWIALERIFRYLRETMCYNLHYTGYPNVMEGFNDANWVIGSRDVKSTTCSC